MSAPLMIPGQPLHEYKDRGDGWCLHCYGAVGIGVGTTSLAQKHDAGKNPLELLPFDALDQVGLVLGHGALKYGRRNWEKGLDWSRLIGAALRHLFAWARGERNDPESGLPHLAHAACCVLFLLAHEMRGIGRDDRREA